jgi:hypothetical protein
MTAAFEELIHLLDEREIGYATGDDLSVRTDLRGGVATYRIVARVEAEADLFQVFGYSPLRVPAGCRPAVAEAVARANYGLRVGKFELDCDDGDMRFQVSQILTGDAVGEEVIDRMIGTAINMLDMYLPAFLSVIYGNELPKDAIRCVEAGRGGGTSEDGEGGTDE